MRRYLRAVGRAALAGAIVVAVSWVGAVPAAAAANSTLGVQGDHIVFLAGSSQVNKLTITSSVVLYIPVVEFNDVYAITPLGSACYRPDAADPTRAVCLASGSLEVRTYDRNDTVVSQSTMGGYFDGGDGDDTINAAAATAAVTIDGGPGNDTLWPGRADDTVHGGAGRDIASYAGRTEKLRINVDVWWYGVHQTSGRVGPVDYEIDDLWEIEGGRGGAGADYIYLEGDGSYADGGPGADYLSCRYSAVDFITVFGGDGDDQIPCSNVAATWLYGGAGNDKIDATDYGDGTAHMHGGAGADVLLGTPNDDVIAGESGADYIDARGGTDVCYGEAHLAWMSDCEYRTWT
jgi:Ca2+-binding RTX toxin-like protein